LSEPDRSHQLGARLVFGPLALAVVGSLFTWDASRHAHLGLGLLMALGVSGALAEFYAMAQRLGHRPMRALGIALGGALTALHWGWIQTDRQGLDPMPPAFLAILAGTFAGVMLRPPPERKMEDLALTLLGVLYLWLPLSFAMRLRMEDWGPAADPLAGHAALLFAVAAGKGSDIGAYFVGSRLGRHALAPVLSPRKTWEGMGGAVLGGGLGGWAVARLWPALPASPMQAGALGALLGPAGQFADLWKSVLKRQAGIKDSGALLPALGGILDMVDSLILVLPCAFYGLLLFRTGA
jgi:phosphatidate cytidylyltransferase